MSTDMAIEFDGVDFLYKRGRPVYGGLNLRCSEFPLVVLGPNGAGKSTLLALLAGRRVAARGEIRLSGSALPTGAHHSPRSAVATLRRSVGWLAQDVTSVRGFTVREQVTYSGWLKGMTRRRALAAADDALESANLTAQAGIAARDLSGGQRRRLGFAQAIVGRPPLLILDEPYAGLDPQQRHDMREVLRGASESTALIVSTHQTEDLEEIYRRVLVLDEGRVRFDGGAQEFLGLGEEGRAPELRAEDAYRAVLRNAR